MAMQRITIGVASAAIIGIVTIAIVSGLLVANRSVSNSGNVKTIGVEVYWDQACTNKVSSIDWGTLEAGGVKSFNVYVKNNGTAAEVLSMMVSNWNPASASSQMSLGWNCTDYVLPHGSVVGAVFTLTVSSSISGVTNFSFDITVVGTENT